MVELFGPTIQGEGPAAGQPAHFIRFGGCDYRCTWCDSMHAVDPAQVRQARRLGVREILRELHALRYGPELVVLTGGNPALLSLGPLIEALRESGFRIAVETQGSRWQDWLGDIDQLVVSPKPPSSGMADAARRDELKRFLERSETTDGLVVVLKVTVFDERDLEWAREVHLAAPALPLFLSVGTAPGEPDERVLAKLRERYRWLCESVARQSEFRDARVLPQLHVLAWGTVRGV